MSNDVLSAVISAWSQKDLPARVHSKQGRFNGLPKSSSEWKFWLYFFLVPKKKQPLWPSIESKALKSGAFQRKSHLAYNLLHSFVRRCLSAIFVLVLAFFQVRAKSFPATEFPFEYHDGFLWVQVTVPQSSEPLNFLFDSGASVSVINLKTAQRLKLDFGRPVAVEGVRSKDMGFYPQHLIAAANGVQLPDSYLAVDLQKLGKACNCCVDGLIGADFFHGRVVQIDFEAHKIRLLKSSDDLVDQTVVPLRVRSCGMEIPIQINGGQPAQVRVDTGCASALQWVTTTVLPKACTQRTAIALNAFTVDEAKSDVDLGGVKFTSVPTGLHSKEIFAGESGLIGNGLLSRFKTVTVDAKHGHLLLGGVMASN